MPHSVEQQKQINECNAKTRAFRRMLLSQFSCIACHETDSDLIDWHHVNPEEKTAGLSCISGHERWWSEVLKCVPLCALCHRKLHKNKLCLLSIKK